MSSQGRRGDWNEAQAGVKRGCEYVKDFEKSPSSKLPQAQQVVVLEVLGLSSIQWLLCNVLHWLHMACCSVHRLLQPTQMAR